MESFHSETVTSSSSPSKEDPIPQNRKKVYTRKARRTGDLISLNSSGVLQQDSKQKGKRKWQNLSFLPKIELADDVRHAVTAINKVKPNRPSLAKKIATFKIGRSMIEGKQFQSRKRTITSHSKFPKIKIQQTNKGERKKGQANSKKVRKSEELVQVLSDAAEKYLSESAIGGAKRKSKSFSRKSEQGNNNALPLVFKHLYVNLIPLENTNLLNAEQLIQLEVKKNMTSPLPLRDVNFNKRHSESSGRKTHVGKENKYKAETPKDAKLSTIQLIDKIKKPHYKKSVLLVENIVPCKVVLEKITLEQIRLLDFSKTRNISLAAALLKENNTSWEAIKINQENINANELATQNACIDAVAPSNDSNLAFFNPEGSSSPLVPLQEYVIKSNECSNIPSTSKRLTYELEENEAKFVHSKNLESDAELENKNATYDAETGSLSRRSSKIRKGFEELPQLSPETNAEPRTSTNKFQRKSRKSSTVNETCELNESNSFASKQKSTENCDEQPGRSSARISKNRRSTLTLEYSINDVALLKSICDTSGVPQTLNKSGKAKSDTSTKQALENKSSSSLVDVSNFTIRKHGSSYAGSMGKSSQRRHSCYESRVDLDSSFEANETDDFKILTSTFEETSKSIRSDNKESSKEEEYIVEDTETPSTSNITAGGLRSYTLSKQIQKAATRSSIIEISDEEETEEESHSATSSETSDVDCEKHLPRQKRKVTFETESMKIKKSKVVFKNNSGTPAVVQKRRVTFNDMSVVVVEDSSMSEESPERRFSSALVPTNFSSDAESNEESPQFNKRGVAGRTPRRLKIPLDNTVSGATPKLNERSRLQNYTLDSPINTSSRKTKMPDFASIHKKMFDKMLNLEEHSKRKDERAKMLLSGHKLKIGSSLKKSASKQPENNSRKKIPAKKLLKYEEPSTSAMLPNKGGTRQKPQLISSTPKGKKNEKTAHTRYGFKVEGNSSVTKKEQLLAVAQKTRPTRESSTVKNKAEIKGVRSNRRFDLLMKMRQNQKK